MLKFKNIIRAAEYELNEHDVYNLRLVLDNVFNYIEKTSSENPDMKISDIIDGITQDVQNYLMKMNKSSIRAKTIEYYMNKKMYSSSEYNLSKAYEEIYKADEKGKINILEDDVSQLQYGYDLKENLRILTQIIVNDVRKEYYTLKEFITNNPDIDCTITELLEMPSKQRDRTIKKAMNNNKEAVKNLKRIYKVLSTGEKNLVQECAREYTENSGKELKAECIEAVVESVKLLDKLGLMEIYNNLTNKLYKNIYIKDYNYSYEEIMKSLSEENLKKQSAEQLVLLSTFWTNRVNKIMKQLNRALYIVNHPEIYECGKLENGETSIKISGENIANVALKMNTIHKIYFDIFPEVEKTMLNQNEENGDEAITINISDAIDSVVKEYSQDYQKYFNKKFPGSENSIEKDLIEANLYENAVYNSYKIKNYNIQALLISLLNNTLKDVENYGYIKEDDLDVSNKKYILIGVDMKGLNMPLRLHINRDLALEVLKGARNGSTLFPVYRCGKDFMFNEDEFMPTHMYVPVSKEKEKLLKEMVDKVQQRDRYGKTIKHLYYLTSKGNMPEHMQKYKGPSYIDLETGEEQFDKEVIK